jgi:hypothetical protein
MPRSIAQAIPLGSRLNSCACGFILVQPDYARMPLTQLCSPPHPWDPTAVTSAGDVYRLSCLGPPSRKAWRPSLVGLYHSPVRRCTSHVPVRSSAAGPQPALMWSLLHSLATSPGGQRQPAAAAQTLISEVGPPYPRGWLSRASGSCK